MVYLASNPMLQATTLQNIIHAAIQHRQLIIPVVGDCMEGDGIEDGGRVAVDCTHYPRPGRRENGVYIPGDPCICWATFPGAPRPSLMCKEYLGVWCGHEVGTCYRQEKGKPYRMNAGFTADLILGVVYASWSKDGKLLWEHDPAEYPIALPDHATIRSSEVGAKLTIERDKEVFHGNAI